jgi:hypothetical protein
MFIFDLNAFKIIFQHYYPSRFPSFWRQFDARIASGEISSVREVLREIEAYGSEDKLLSWAKRNSQVFHAPTDAEMHFVAEIFKIRHFQTLISKKSSLMGKPVADPFLIARAKINSFTVVTLEQYKDNAAKIPNVCKYFSIDCINLEECMERLKWTF